MKRCLALVLLLLLLAGCGREAAQDPSQAPPQQSDVEEPAREPVATEPPPPVFADWTRLEGQADLLTEPAYFWGEPRLELTASADYGRLLPYTGKDLEIYWDEFSHWNTYRWGLATADGRCVVEPVYDAVQPLYYNGTELPVYRLHQSVASDPGDPESTETLSALAAFDGSWCTPMDYTFVQAVDRDRILLCDREGVLWLCDLSGGLMRCPLDQSPDELWVSWWREGLSCSQGVACMNARDGDGTCMVELENGEVHFLPDIQYISCWGVDAPLFPAESANGFYGYLDHHGQWAIPPQFMFADYFSGDYAVVSRQNDWDRDREIIDQTGNTVLQINGRLITLTLDGKQRYVVVDEDLRILELYDEQLQAQPDHPAIGQTLDDSYWGYLVWTDGEGKTWLWWNDQAVQLPNCLSIWDAAGDLLLLETKEDLDADVEEMYEWGVYDVSSGSWILSSTTDSISLIRDQENGDVYFTVGNDMGSCDVLDQTGKKLFSAAWVNNPVNGVFSVQSGTWGGLIGPDGKWLLRRALETADD